jgi:hypothetical protein
VREQRVLANRQPQVLAPSPGSIDRPAGQAGHEVGRAGLVPANRARVQDLDRLDTPSHDELLEPAPDYLDLGQLRHWLT